MGRSRGGFSTKVHALVDAQGRPLHIELTPGQQHESTVAEDIIRAHARGQKLLADTAYDSDAIRRCVKELGMKPVIHPHPMRKRKRRLDREAYSTRYRVECFFHRLKRYRGLASRFDKTARHYLAHLQLACAKIWLDELLPVRRKTRDSP